MYEAHFGKKNIADIEKYNFSRSLYYKAGYLIDFPRTINSLSQAPDANHQVALFEKRLKQKQYFSSPVNDRDPLAELCQWEDFIKWLEKTKSDETMSQDSEATEHRTAPNGSNGISAPFLETKSTSEPAIATQSILGSNKTESSQANGSHVNTIDPSSEDSPRGLTFPKSAKVLTKKRSSIFGFLKRSVKPVKPVKTM